jgi:polar amino acid transport system permease protein
MHWDVVWNNIDYFLWGSLTIDTRNMTVTGDLGGLALAVVLAVLGIVGAVGGSVFHNRPSRPYAVWR